MLPRNETFAKTTKKRKLDDPKIVNDELQPLSAVEAFLREYGGEYNNALFFQPNPGATEYNIAQLQRIETEDSPQKKKKKDRDAAIEKILSNQDLLPRKLQELTLTRKYVWVGNVYHNAFQTLALEKKVRRGIEWRPNRPSDDQQLYEIKNVENYLNFWNTIAKENGNYPPQTLAGLTNPPKKKNADTGMTRDEAREKILSNPIFLPEKIKALSPKYFYIKNEYHNALITLRRKSNNSEKRSGLSYRASNSSDNDHYYEIRNSDDYTGFWNSLVKEHDNYLSQKIAERPTETTLDSQPEALSAYELLTPGTIASVLREDNNVPEATEKNNQPQVNDAEIGKNELPSSGEIADFFSDDGCGYSPLLFPQEANDLDGENLSEDDLERWTRLNP